MPGGWDQTTGHFGDVKAFHVITKSGSLAEAYPGEGLTATDPLSMRRSSVALPLLGILLATAIHFQQPLDSISV